MTKTNERYKKQRVRLFKEQDGKCYWCQEPMRLLTFGPKVKKMPIDACTIDHLDDRFSPERGRYGWGHKRRVAACWKCNTERGKASQAEVSKDFLRMKAQHLPPKWMPKDD